MNDRPEHFRYETQFGKVVQVYRDTWECDLLSEAGGRINRALIIGPRRPEVSTPERPQWALYGHADAAQGKPWCLPVDSRLPGPRTERGQWVWYDEVGNFRITINEDNELEIRNTDGDALHRIRIQQDGGVVRLDTPRTRIVLREQDQSITIECDEKLSVACNDVQVNAAGNADVRVEKDASVQVVGDANMLVGGNVTATIAGVVTYSAPSATFTIPTLAIVGAVNITGRLDIVEAP